MTEKQITNKEWAEYAAKCMDLLGKWRPIDHRIIVSTRTYKKIKSMDEALKAKLFKPGKWEEK